MFIKPALLFDFCFVSAVLIVFFDFVVNEKILDWTEHQSFLKRCEKNMVFFFSIQFDPNKQRRWTYFWCSVAIVPFCFPALPTSFKIGQHDTVGWSELLCFSWPRRNGSKWLQWCMCEGEFKTTFFGCSRRWTNGLRLVHILPVNEDD